MTRFMLLAVAASCLLAGYVSGRVVEPSRSQHTLEDLPSLNDLLQDADPADNDIYYEHHPQVSASPRRPARPTSFSPTHHFLDTLSMPRYVDASEFRRDQQGPLPPALDINRQLTLLSASKRIRPPVRVVESQQQNDEVPLSSPVYFPNTAPLFREDFPTVVEDTDYPQEEYPDESLVVGNNTADDTEPIISTSVSMSTSVSYSNGSSIQLSPGQSSTDASPTNMTDLTATTQPDELTASSTTPSSTTSTTTAATNTTSAETAAEATDQVQASPLTSGGNGTMQADSEVETRSGRFLKYDFIPDYPEYGALSPLSPLAHIIGGFHGELGSFGGDIGREDYFRGFRPVGF